MDGRPILVSACLNGREDLLAEHHERVAWIVGDSDALTRHHADEALPSRDAPREKTQISLQDLKAVLFRQGLQSKPKSFTDDADAMQQYGCPRLDSARA